jgi:hypothetical protein
VATETQSDQNPTQSVDDREFQPEEVQQHTIDIDNKERADMNSDTTHHYNLRPRNSTWKNDKYADHYVNAVILTKSSIPKAMKLFESEALAAAMKEVNQLHDKGVWSPVKYEDIKDTDKIIRSLIFLKRKRDGTLKARLVADGQDVCKFVIAVTTYHHPQSPPTPCLHWQPYSQPNIAILSRLTLKVRSCMAS